MNKKACPSCRLEINSNAPYCPSCLTVFTASNNNIPAKAAPKVLKTEKEDKNSPFAVRNGIKCTHSNCYEQAYKTHDGIWYCYEHYMSKWAKGYQLKRPADTNKNAMSRYIISVGKDSPEWRTFTNEQKLEAVKWFNENPYHPLVLAKQHKKVFNQSAAIAVLVQDKVIEQGDLAL